MSVTERKQRKNKDLYISPKNSSSLKIKKKEVLKPGEMEKMALGAEPHPCLLDVFSVLTGWVPMATTQYLSLSLLMVILFIFPSQNGKRN